MNLGTGKRLFYCPDLQVSTPFSHTNLKLKLRLPKAACREVRPPTHSGTWCQSVFDPNRPVVGRVPMFTLVRWNDRLVVSELLIMLNSGVKRLACGIELGR